jgi:hypothetical protein
MDDLKRLSGNISAADARDFQSISDKIGKEDIEMNLLVDEEAIFTITSTLEAKAPYLDLPDNWEQWETEWSHRELAKIITLIWGKGSDKTHVSIEDEIRDYDLMIDTNKMALSNIGGEQTVIGGLMKIFARRPVKDFNTKEKLKKYVGTIHKKLPVDNIFRLDIEALPKKAETVVEWVSQFKAAREKGRQILAASLRYGAKMPEIDQAYLNQKKRLPQDNSFKSESARQESKRVKRLQNQERKESNHQGRPPPDWTKPHCNACGLPGHETAKCWLHIQPAHTDRNTEALPFELSTKGLAWIANVKGPYCLAKWYLNGNPRVQPANPTQQSKSMTTMLTTILNKIKLHKNTHSDYLTIFVSLPQTQTMLLEEEGVVEMTQEVTVQGIRAAADAAAEEDKFLVQALLDTGCLVGDCISQEIVDKLNASHLIVRIATTICSGFDNNCSSDFPSLVIKITFNHENTFLRIFPYKGINIT